MRRPTRMHPTERDLQVFKVVRRHLRAFHQAPTRAEIGRELGISRPVVDFHLQALRRSGLVRLRKRWRGIEIVQTP